MSSIDSDQPGFALFDPDSESETESSQNSYNDQYDLDHYLVNPNAIPDPDPYLDTNGSDSQELDSINQNTLNMHSVQDNFLISPDAIA